MAIENKRERTNRGFQRIEFKDSNGNECSLQESSWAETEAIWLGQNGGTHHMGECLARMHLTREQAKWLIEELKYFVRTGRLKE